LNDPTRLDYEFHRTLALAWYYGIDFVGILFMIRAVMGLNRINNQKHLKIQQDMITGKDFTVQLNDVEIDPYSQNLHILQMKIWLQLLDYFKE